MSLTEPPLAQLPGDGEGLIQRAEAAIANEELAEAVRLADAAEHAGAEPDRCAGNRWMAHMLGGDFHAAWRESDAIRGRGAPDPHRFWTGEELRGKRVILRSLHGFGDAVQMFRFLPRLQALASHLIVEVPPRLMELAPYFDGMGEVITWGDHAPTEPPAWDVQIEVMELPYLLGVSTADLEPTQGYLHLPASLKAEVEAVMGPKQRPRVGVVWTAGIWNPSRSISAAVVQELSHVQDVEFWDLEHRQELGTETSAFEGWRDASACGDGILRLAAVIQAMDLMITVDTLAAHLAGALGIPCFLLLQNRADWRWMARRTDSPWYPSLRLYRQSAPGDWIGLVAQVTADINRWKVNVKAPELLASKG
ncbi:MAG: glycosyltransferase family 9 protein [Janthinobacterium lividum]